MYPILTKQVLRKALSLKSIRFGIDHELHNLGLTTNWRRRLTSVPTLFLQGLILDYIEAGRWDLYFQEFLILLLCGNPKCLAKQYYRYIKFRWKLIDKYLKIFLPIWLFKTKKNSLLYGKMFHTYRYNDLKSCKKDI